MKKKFALIAFVLLCGGTAYAQSVRVQQENPVVTAFTDSLADLKASYFAYFRMWDDLNIPAPRRVRLDPDYYKLFVPPTYYLSPVEQAFAIDWSPKDYYARTAASTDSIYQVLNDTHPRFTLPDVETSAKKDRWVNKLLLDFYLKHPSMVVGNEQYLAGLKPLVNDQIVKQPKKEHVKKFLQSEEPVKNVKENDLLVMKPNFWTKKGNGYLQFTQLYISDNWYKGGESTNSMLSGLVLESNYDDKQRLEFENKMEIKLGFVTAPSDTVHKYKTNADMLRLNSKLGVKAFKNWYYTLAAEFKTQFFANYGTNSNNMISNFLSPAEFDLTLGMDFKQSKKNYTMSLLTSPLAYTFIYINNDKIQDPTAFNVKPGRSTANLWGSKFVGNLSWKIIPSVVWESKFEYFTTYEKVIASWENTFNFILNRYLSTKLFLHARYDDGVTLTETNTSYFQLQEILSFGINYTW